MVDTIEENLCEANYIDDIPDLEKIRKNVFLEDVSDQESEEYCKLSGINILTIQKSIFAMKNKISNLKTELDFLKHSLTDLSLKLKSIL